MMMPASGSTSSVHTTDVAKRRNASELSLIGSAVHAVAETSDRLDDLGGDLFAQAANEDLDRVAIAIEVLLIEMLDQLRARDNTAAVMHEIGEEAVFMGRELDLLSVAGDTRRLRIEPDRPALYLALRMARGAPHLC